LGARASKANQPIAEQGFQRIAFPLTVSFGFALMNSLSGSLGVETWLLSLGLVWAFMAKIILDLFQSLFSKFLFMAVVLLQLIPMLGAQTLVPYQWWGIQDDALSEKRTPSNISGLSGFNLGGDTEALFGHLDQTFHKLEQNPVNGFGILLGPNIAGLAGQVFTNVKTYPLKCPIEWFDLCSEEQTLDDLRSLQKQLPSAVVWNVVPEYVLEGHEKAFRNGTRSGIRSIQNWLSSKVEDGTYRLESEYVIGANEVTSWRLKTLIKN
jgi:hypothetical protein